MNKKETLELALWGRHLDVVSDQMAEEVLRVIMGLTDARDWNRDELKGMIEATIFITLMKYNT